MFNCTVYLVGAGPGDIGLLTLRAKELIEKCQVLIYDNLVNRHIIVSMTSTACEKIFVGKSGAHHEMEQDEINNLIVEKARTGKMVVRLKGGDPYIFGRGGEEALFLHENGIYFEVVNGISSAYAVPNYAGIPVTNRGYSSSVAFITGHEDPSKLESEIRWDNLAAGVQTLVFLMGVKNLPLIVRKLMENGLDASVPAAVIQDGCQPMQRTVSGTLGDIADKARSANIVPPSVIIVGEVVSLRQELNWFEIRPLSGKTIVVTRSQEHTPRLSARLMDLGARIIEVPVFKVAPLDDTAPIRRAIARLNSYDWIVFMSVSDVTGFFEAIKELGIDTRTLSLCRVCAIGLATVEELRRRGISPDILPSKYGSADIIHSLIGMNAVRGRSFLLPRADIASRKLPDSLLREGAECVDDIPVYRMICNEQLDHTELKELLEEGTVDLVTFNSPSAVHCFDRLIRKDHAELLGSFRCAVIGPATAGTARRLGYNVDVSAEAHTVDGLVEAVLRHYDRREPRELAD